MMMLGIAVAAVSGCGSHNLQDRVFSGTLEMTEHQVGVKVAGRVASLTVKEGDAVKAGQVIATMDRYAQAKKDFERTQALLAKGGATAQAVEYAALAVEDQQVVSPVDGIVLVKVHEVGEIAASGAPVVVVGDMNDRWVRIFVPEGLINQIRLQQEVSVTFDGLKKTYRGYVRYIATKAEFTPRNVQTQEERVTQGFAVKVAIDDSALEAHPGVAADIRFK